MPLLLEVNTRNTTLRDVVEKIVKVKLGMNLPMVMQGSTLIYEVGDDLEEDVAANYALNLDKVVICSGMVFLFPDICLSWSL